MIKAADFLAMQARLALKQGRKAPVADAVERELTLHNDILAWCAGQWPRWKVLRARPDQPSTIAEGAHDLTIFAPRSRVICVECKRKDGKLRPSQQSWRLELELLGHNVHVVRSMSEFLELARTEA